MDQCFLKLLYANGPDLLKQVQAYLAAGGDPVSMTQHGESPLRVASSNGRFDVVKVLLDAGALLDELVWDELFLVTALGTVDELRDLIKESPSLEARDQWSQTPWLVAIQSGSIDKVKRLVAAGCNTLARGRCERLPLAYAIERDNLSMLRWLIDQGEDVNGRDEHGGTPLHCAAELGSVRCAAALIERGADISAEDHIPYRAIESAQSREMVELLLEAGEDINLLGRGRG